MCRREALQRITIGEKRIVFLSYKGIIRKTQELQKISPPLPELYQNLYSYGRNQKFRDTHVEAHNNGDQSGDIYPLLRTYPLYHLDVYQKSQKTRHQANVIYLNEKPVLTLVLIE
jgi:hypothetical protein